MATLLLCLATLSLIVALAGLSRGLIVELQARRDSLCARYAARAAITLAMAGTGSGWAASLLGPPVSWTSAALLPLSPGACVLEGLGRCGGASRLLVQRDHGLTCPP